MVLGVDDVEVAGAYGVQVEQHNPGKGNERHAGVEPTPDGPAHEQVVREEHRQRCGGEKGVDPDEHHAS